MGLLVRLLSVGGEKRVLKEGVYSYQGGEERVSHIDVVVGNYGG